VASDEKEIEQRSLTYFFALFQNPNPFFAAIDTWVVILRLSLVIRH
jgi:hypothetical protein